MQNSELQNVSDMKPKKKRHRAIRIGELLSIQNYVSSEAVLSNLPFLLFLVGLTMLYIGNIHFAERTVRSINRTEKQFKEMKWEYMSTKAELMYKSKQSQVARMVAPLGLRELTRPPKVLKVKVE